MKTQWGCLMLTLALCASACDVGVRRGFTLADSAGISVASNLWNGEWFVPEWTLESEPFFSVGDPAPSPEYELHRVYYARSFPDGRVAVSMNLIEIRIFDGDGDYLITIGREGQGPGEFAFLWDAHPLGDSLVRAIDIRNRRTSLFDAWTGELKVEHPSVRGFSNPNGVAVLADGTYAGVTGAYSDSELGTPDSFIIRFNAEGTSVDTIGPLFALRATEMPGPQTMTRPQFQPSFRSTAAGVNVWGGWQGSYDIRRYNQDGTLEQILKNSFEGELVTERMKAAVPMGMPPMEMTFPDRMPPWDQLLATPSGWLWIRRYRSPLEEDFNTWDIYDPDGRLTSFIRIPASARIDELGEDYLMGIFRNELDIEMVQKYRLVKN